jgi:hypothetical protein
VGRGLWVGVALTRALLLRRWVWVAVPVAAWHREALGEALGQLVMEGVEEWQGEALAEALVVGRAGEGLPLPL